MTVIGTLIGERFRLEEKIGSGGMSSVYRAFDPTLERSVAIKMLHRDISSDPDQLERFRREARAVARLNHPHVVTVIDAGEDEGAPYIVFEYVEGETLKERIRRLGRLPTDEAIAYAIEIGRALECAHAHKLVHRDVKPQNVLIDPDGRAKVTDFGIARSLEVQGLTAPGRVLGTTDYVSPEQALGHEVAEQSDIYSLGVVLYEMLTGEVPFKADTQVAVAMKHVREPLPDAQRRRPEISATLAAVVERAHRQGDAEPLCDGRRDGARPGGGARDRGRPHRPGDRRGHHRAALAVRRHRGLRPPPAPAPGARALPDARRARAGRRGDRLLRHPHRAGPRPGRHAERAGSLGGQGWPGTRRTTTTPRATARSRRARSSSPSTACPPPSGTPKATRADSRRRTSAGSASDHRRREPRGRPPARPRDFNPGIQGGGLRLRQRAEPDRALDQGEPRTRA